MRANEISMGDSSRSVDFFISYTGADSAWAEWVAWQLKNAGYQVFLQKWHIAPGHDFVHKMQDGLGRAHRVLPILSHAYVSSSEFGEAEWRKFFRDDPSGVGRKIIPVRVTDVEPPELLSTRVYIELLNRTEEQAKEALLAGVSDHFGEPSSVPPYPGEPPPPFPSSLPPAQAPTAVHTVDMGTALARQVGTKPVVRRSIYISHTFGLDRYPLNGSYVDAAVATVEVVGDVYSCSSTSNEARTPSACVQQIRESDVYVGLIGNHYRLHENHAWPLIEHEYDEARKTGIPCLLYVLDPDVSHGFPDGLRNTDQEQQGLIRFRDRLRRDFPDKLRRPVRDPEDLRYRLHADLLTWLPAQHDALPSDSEFIDATAYEGSSETQQQQMERLLALVDVFDNDDVIDVGCGTGRLSLAIAPTVRRVIGIDKNPDMVRLAKRNASKMHAKAQFEVANLLEYENPSAFSLVLSNHTMHWIAEVRDAYGKLYELLREGGRLAVHQGGSGTYSGLINLGFAIAAEPDYAEYFQHWRRYPHYYPKVDEIRDLLTAVGFEDVEILSSQTSGREFPNLIDDFAVAGLVPFLRRLPQGWGPRFQARFIEVAKSEDVDRSTHSLYIFARRL